MADKKRRYWLSGEFNRVAPPPQAQKDNTVDHYHGTAVPDPYRPLEKLDDLTTQMWVRAENDRFQSFLKDEETLIDETIAFLEDIYDYPKESLPARYGKKYFSTYNSGLANQAVIQLRDDLEDEPTVLIDPNTLSDDGTVALSGYYPSPNGKYVAYTVAEAGSDALTLKVRDVETGQDLPDEIPGLRFTGVYWNQNSTGFRYAAPSPTYDKSFDTKQHKLGNDITNDKTIFTASEDNAHTATYRIKDSAYEWGSVSIGSDSRNGLFMKEKGRKKPFRELFAPGKASYQPIAQVGDKTYMITDHEAPNGKLVAFDPDNPAPENWETIIEESPDNVLEGAFIHKDLVFASYSNEGADRLKIYEKNGTFKQEADLPENSTFTLGRLDEDSDKILMQISSFQQPGEIHEYDITANKLTRIKESPAKELLDDCIVEHIYATSKDGTKVPMTVIRHPDTELDGTAAVKLYGYGGFNISLGPVYSPGIVNWIRAGGIYVQANLRGGGELGADWYDQGRLLNKQNVFDDFIACAEHLIASDYTSPERLVSAGGSNGGLLTLATMLQRPDLFGAVTSAVPVTDLFRFHKHTYGAAWKSDYGDIESCKDDFNAAAAYSPLHNIKPGTHYPPCLVTTGDHDDRVVPSHAYKFVATLQEHADADTISLLRVDERAGHGAGKPLSKVIREIAEVHAFIEKAIGPIDQQEYKKALAARIAAEAANDNKPDPGQDNRNENSGPSFGLA